MPSKDWESQALCSNAWPDADWFPTRYTGLRARAAITVCRWCPVAKECLDQALQGEQKPTDRNGIFAGTTPADREALWPFPHNVGGAPRTLNRDRLTLLHGKGYTDRQLAAALGMESLPALSQARRRLGLTRNKDPLEGLVAYKRRASK